MTLTEQIASFQQRTNELIESNPGITNIWWEIENASLSEMRLLEHDNCLMDYSEPRQCMRLLVSGGNSTIFIFSKKVKIVKAEFIELQEA